MKALLADYDPMQNFEFFEKLVTEDEPIRKWSDFQKWARRFREDGSFRGHADASWSLKTTLDRAVWKTYSAETSQIQSTTTKRVNIEENEKALLLAFQRVAHHYLARTPNHDQTMDWLAMMQHYGAPTRLLDWTRSPHVALYFALRNQKEANAALWSIDLKWFEQRSLALLRQKDPAWPDGSNFRTQCEYPWRVSCA